MHSVKRKKKRTGLERKGYSQFRGGENLLGNERIREGGELDVD